jgi:hypothetical protein
MRRILAVPICIALATLTATPKASACGDKLVALGGGMSFEQVTARRPVGNIVILLAPESSPNDIDQARQLQAVLERAGHSVIMAHDPLELRSALDAWAPDLLLSDWADASDSFLDAPQTALPTFLRVRYGGAAAREPYASRGRNACVVDAGKRNGRQVVKAVSELLKLRDKGLPMQCDRAS